MKTVYVAILFLYDPEQDAYAIVRSDHLHPVPSLRYQYKGIGGIVETGGGISENHRDAAVRELREEFPAVWDISPSELTEVGEVDGGTSVGRDGQPIHWVWSGWSADADLSKDKYQLARNSATESNIYIFYGDNCPAPEECMPGFHDLIQLFLRKERG